jgi:hypothetical protein
MTFNGAFSTAEWRLSGAVAPGLYNLALERLREERAGQPGADRALKPAAVGSNSTRGDRRRGARHGRWRPLAPAAS